MGALQLKFHLRLLLQQPLACCQELRFCHLYRIPEDLRIRHVHHVLGKAKGGHRPAGAARVEGEHEAQAALPGEGPLQQVGELALAEVVACAACCNVLDDHGHQRQAGVGVAVLGRQTGSLRACKVADVGVACESHAVHGGGVQLDGAHSVAAGAYFIELCGLGLPPLPALLQDGLAVLASVDLTPVGPLHLLIDDAEVHAVRAQQIIDTLVVNLHHAHADLEGCVLILSEQELLQEAQHEAAHGVGLAGTRLPIGKQRKVHPVQEVVQVALKQLPDVLLLRCIVQCVGDLDGLLVYLHCAGGFVNVHQHWKLCVLLLLPLRPKAGNHHRPHMQLCSGRPHPHPNATTRLSVPPIRVDQSRYCRRSNPA
mmetsp:Transcript_1877/g.5465  ORF Transcript_1877/g.5465 Transcript_1877/m.5465 type:complete len:369 (+) Transcript_1877:1577-2683(+)